MQPQPSEATSVVFAFATVNFLTRASTDRDDRVSPFYSMVHRAEYSLALRFDGLEQRSHTTR
jgi:hypothetical protein